MTGKSSIDAGICGFITDVTATCEDYQNVSFAISTQCPKTTQYAQSLLAKGPIDAYGELASRAASVVISLGEPCCISCPVPIGVFRAMQVAAGLALPKDAALKIRKEE